MTPWSVDASAAVANATAAGHPYDTVPITTRRDRKFEQETFGPNGRSRTGPPSCPIGGLQVQARAAFRALLADGVDVPLPHDLIVVALEVDLEGVLG